MQVNPNHNEDGRPAGDLAERPDLTDSFGTSAERAGQPKGPSQELAQALSATKARVAEVRKSATRGILPQGISTYFTGRHVKLRLRA